jgi:threonine/homoserine/homoserine lactone efflux protein
MQAEEISMRSTPESPPGALDYGRDDAARGARRGLGYMAGIVIGIVGVMGIATTGVMGVLLAMPGATPVVIAAAAAYFAYLAFRIATAPPLADDAGRQLMPRKRSNPTQSAYCKIRVIF